MKTKILKLVGLLLLTNLPGQQNGRFPFGGSNSVATTLQNITSPEELTPLNSNELTYWKPVYKIPSNQIVWSLKVLDEKTIWATSQYYWWVSNTSDKNYLYRSIDGGKTWLQIKVPGKCLFYALDSLNVWISVYQKGLFKTTDGGKSWNTVLDDKRWGPIYFFDKDTGFFVGINPAKTDTMHMYKTTNGGISWQQTNLYSWGIPQGIAFNPTNYDLLSYKGDTLFLPPLYGKIFYTYNKGKDWDTLNSCFAKADLFNGSIFKNKNTFAIVDWQKRSVAATIDGGKSWFKNEKLPLSAPLVMSDVPGSDSVYMLASYLYSGGVGGTMISNDYGKTFEMIDKSINPIVMNFLNKDIGFCASFNDNDARFGLNQNYIYQWVPDGIVSVKSIKTNSNELIEIFPNPVSDILKVTNQSSVTQHYSIVNLQGQMVSSGNLQRGTNELNIKTLQNGVYIIKVLNAQGNQFQKFLKE